MIFSEIDVNMPGLEAVFEPPTSTMPTFIYHDVEHERVSSHDVMGREVLKEDDAPVRLEIRQTIEPAINHEYMYEYGNGNSTTKSGQVEYEDAEKRRVRRERNKLAASKCRKKRKDHVRNLVESYEQLEMCNKNLETEIEKLHSEIKDLEKMLDTHPCTRLLYTESGNDVLQ